MNQVRILIADSSAQWGAALLRQLKTHYSVRTACSGKDAWEQLQTFLPDILILDLLLPGVDGITLLRQCAARQLTPKVIVTTRLCSEYVLSALTQLGISYLMLKPCPPENIAGCVGQLTSLCPPAADRPGESADRLLLRLGLPGKLSGTKYLSRAIACYLENPDQMLTKELYGAVGQQFHASAAQVERSARTAIRRGWEERDNTLWQRYFPVGPDGQVRRPTNGEFIFQLAQWLRS